MSLINEMLNDLEARRGGRAPDAGHLLDGVHAVGVNEMRRDRSALRWLGALGAGVAGGCLAWYALGMVSGGSAPAARVEPTAAPAVAAAAPLTAKAHAGPGEGVPLAAPAPAVSAPAMEVAAEPAAQTATEADPPASPGSGAGAAHGDLAAVSVPTTSSLSPTSLPTRAAPVSATAEDARTTVSVVAAEEDAAAAPSDRELQHGTGGAVAATPPREPAAVEQAGTVSKAPSSATPTPARRLAGILARMRRDPAAGEALQELVAAEPGFAPARAALAAHLIRSGDRPAAERVLGEGLARTPDEPRLALMLAHLLVERGDPEAALGVLAGATPPADDPAEYLAFTAALEQRLGRHSNAIAAYRRALGAAPGRGAWWVGLGISLAARAEQEAASEAFRRALGDRDLSATLRRYANRELGRIDGQG